MATTENLRKAVSDEGKAVRDYERSSQEAKAEDQPRVASKFKHVRSEEKQHKREFKRLLKRGARR
jgi:rubrerythrin